MCSKRNFINRAELRIHFIFQKHYIFWNSNNITLSTLKRIISAHRNENSPKYFTENSADENKKKNHTKTTPKINHNDMTCLFPCRNFNVSNNSVFGMHPLRDPNFLITFMCFPIKMSNEFQQNSMSIQE